MLIPTESIDTPGKKWNLSTMAEEEYDEWNQGEEEEEGIDSMIIGGVAFGILLVIVTILYYNEMLCFKGEKGKKVEEVSEKMKKETEKIKANETEDESKVEFIDEDGDTQILTYHEESKTWDYQQQVAPKNQGRIEEGKDFTDCFHEGVTLQFEPDIGYIECTYADGRFSNVVPEDQRTAVMKKMKSLQSENYPVVISADSDNQSIPKLLNFDATEIKWKYEWYDIFNEEEKNKKQITKTNSLDTIDEQFVILNPDFNNLQEVHDFMTNVLASGFENSLKKKKIHELTALQNDEDIENLEIQYGFQKNSDYSVTDIIKKVKAQKEMETRIEE